MYQYASRIYTVMYIICSYGQTHHQQQNILRPIPREQGQMHTHQCAEMILVWSWWLLQALQVPCNVLYPPKGKQHFWLISLNIYPYYSDLLIIILYMYLIVPFWYASAAYQFVWAMARILARHSWAKTPMARPNESDLPSKQTKKVQLQGVGIYCTQIQPKI